MLKPLFFFSGLCAATAAHAWESRPAQTPPRQQTAQIQDMLYIEPPAPRRAKRAEWRWQIKLWPDNTIPYLLDQADSSTRMAVQAAIAELEGKVAVRFVARTTERDYVNIKTGGRHPQLCGESYLGAVGIGAQTLWLAPDCDQRTTALHELVHAMGFHHGEHWDPNFQLDLENRDTLSDSDIRILQRVYPLRPPTKRSAQNVRQAHHTDTPTPPARPASADGYQLISGYNQRCLEAHPTDMRSTRLKPCSPSAAQRWHKDPDGRITSSAYPGYCLGIRHWTAAHQAIVELLTCDGSPWQRWYHGKIPRILSAADPSATLSHSSADGLLVAPKAGNVRWQAWFWRP